MGQSHGTLKKARRIRSHQEKTGQSHDTCTLKKAEQIRSHQGNHECEVSCGGEADLQKHFTRCEKNPGHSQFIPFPDFKKEHLPPGYRDNLIFDWIRARADRTCRLSVDYTSENRPTYHPVDKSVLYPFSQDRGSHWMRVGTGWMNYVYKYTEEDNKPCPCHDCKNPSTHTPHKVWGKVIIWTATHVIFDDEEARRTTCHFGYDTSTTVLSRDCIKLTGFKVEGSDVIQDWCKMTYVTHDMDTVNKLYKMWSHSKDLWNKMYDKYGPNKNTSLSVPRVSCLTNHTPGPVIIVSHPHGQSKQISVGKWTHRQTGGEIEKRKHIYTGWVADSVLTSYTYNAHTCPGSSGAPMYRLPEKGQEWWELVTRHPHSEGSKDNNDNNTSATVVEWVSKPRPPEDK